MPRPILEVFADESCQTQHQFLVLGGVSCLATDTPAIEHGCATIRARHNTHGEAKWSKVSRSKLGFYSDYIGVLFDAIDAHKARFSCLIADTSTFDHATHNHGNKEIGFNKLIYQLLLHKFAKPYGDTHLIHIYLDARTTRHSLEELRGILNSGLAKNWDIRGWPIRRLHFRDSRASELIQLNDIVLGAMGFRKNGHHRATGASDAKLALAKLIEKRARVNNLTSDTAKDAPRFGVWNFSFYSARKRVRPV